MGYNQEKRRSLFERDSISLEKNKKREETNASSYGSSSYKALNLGYDLKDEKEAFVDHKKKSMMERDSKTITDGRRGTNFERPNKTAYVQEKTQQLENIKRFKMHEDYSLSDEPAESESEIDE